MGYKLSVIIPYYNAKPYTDELLDVLAKQIRNDIEVIIVDDGSKEPYRTPHSWVTVYYKTNGGCSTARNYGLNKATGEYIQFIDADDLVPEYFFSKLFTAFTKNPDVIEFSWRSLSTDGPQHKHVLHNEGERLNNPSVCTRCFKRSFIGNVRFNEKKDSTEDEDFSRRIGYLDPDANINRAVITEYMYYYRTEITDSKVKRFKRGLMNTKRIVYHYDHVTKDMSWLVDEIRKEDERNEVWLITNNNELPELKRHCQISKPLNIWGHELRGEPYSRFTKIEPPIKCDVIMYLEYANLVGGIASFIYYWVSEMKDVDTVVLYDRLDDLQIDRIKTAARIFKNDGTHEFICNTLILNRLTDKIPQGITYNKTIQVCHACKQVAYPIPQGRDYLVNVSQTSKDTWGETSKDGIVIHNMFHDESKELFIVSATRMNAKDKGSNDARIRRLAEMLNEKDIKFTWLNFSDKPLPDPPENFINMGPKLNIQSFIKRADYMVLLSDKEAYSMAILEALSLNTAVIVTEMAVVPEFKIVDSVNGYIVPFDMNFDVTKLLNVPKFTYTNDNAKAKMQWKKLLGMPGIPKTTALEKKIPATPSNEEVSVKVLRSFKDKYTGELIPKGSTSFPKQRVDEILEAQKTSRFKLIEVLK